MADYNKTTWTNRSVEFPNRYTMSTNADGTINLVPSPGTIYQSGTPLTADNLNNLEKQYDSSQQLFNVYSSGTDSNGINTIVEYQRKDGTLYLRSTLSNLDGANHYLTDTWTFYDTNGTTLLKTVTWTLTYDTSDNITQRVQS